MIANTIHPKKESAIQSGLQLNASDMLRATSFLTPLSQTQLYFLGKQKSYSTISKATLSGLINVSVSVMEMHKILEVVGYIVNSGPLIRQASMGLIPRP